MGHDLISIDEATEQGICRLRCPVWTDKRDYLRVDVLAKGERGPWCHLFSRRNEAIGAPNPQSMIIGLSIDPASKEYEPHEGEIDPADTFKRLSP